MTERILIAEDEDALAFVLREALKRDRYEPEVVSTARALVDRLKESACDLILLDVRLPHMEGVDAIAHCRDLAPETPARCSRPGRRASRS